MRVLELHAGIGGCAAALSRLAPTARVVAAVDVHRGALEVYEHNFPHHPTVARSVESFSAAELAAYEADLWWMSPPCQPFTRRGKGLDDEDPRSRGLLALVERIAEVRPPHLALENVPGFAGSRSHGRLRRALETAGYDVAERLLCPSELGVPNRRRRFYLVASRTALLPFRDPPLRDDPLADYVEPSTPAAAELLVSPAVARAYEGALSVVDPTDPRALTACFTAAYGRSHVRSGSYLRLGDGSLRRFTPREILRLLTFPESYRLPPDLSDHKAWRLVGNSLSVLAVEAVLSALLVRPQPT